MKANKYLSFLLILVASCLSSCGTKSNPTNINGILKLEFNEGSGVMVRDSFKKNADKKVSYVYNQSTTLEYNSLPWSESAVEGTSLLFDGYSTWIDYGDDIKVSGNKLSINAWVAPRSYDWDKIDAKDNGEEYLTGIVSQFLHSDDTGFILGYHRDGEWSFQCGTGSNWYRLWDEGTPLSKYEWNNVAAVFDGEEGYMAIYLNGKIVNRMEIPKNSSIKYADMPLLVGKSNYSRSDGGCVQGVVSGLMDNIVLTKSVSSSLEIRENYQKYKENLKPINFSDIFLQNVLKDDQYKTQYHGGPTEHWMNEPHAPIYYKGVYHLFYQSNINGPYFNEANGISWGHLVSEDMVNYRPIKEAITFSKDSVCPDGVWSGGSTYTTVKGVENVPALLFTAGDYAHNGMISNQNIGLATPKDPNDPYLTEWEVSPKLAVEQKSGQGVTNEFRDAHVWIEDDTYYMLVGSSLGSRGTALLYTSSKSQDDPLHNWTYHGPVFDYPEQSSKYGSTWELPVMLPLRNSNGEATGKYLFAISPAPATTADNNVVYWIGTFNKSTFKFIPDKYGDPERMDYGGNCFTGPSGFIDTNENSPTYNQCVMLSIMQDQLESAVRASYGWANCVGIARVLTLSNDNKLEIKEVSTLNSYKTTLYEGNNVSTATVNQNISSIKEDMVCIDLDYKVNSDDAKVIVNVKQTPDKEEFTQLSYSASNQIAYANTSLNKNGNSNCSNEFSGTVSRKDEMTLRIYVDRSLIETFFNNEKTISCRAYSLSKEAKGIEIITEGNIEITHIKISSMKSIY